MTKNEDSRFAQTQAVIDQEVAESRERDRVEAAFETFYAKHPELIPNQANTNVITDYLGGSEFVDRDSLEQALGHQNLVQSLSYTDSNENQRLVDEICELMRGGTSTDAINHWRTRDAKYLDNVQLREKKAELERRVEFRSKSKGELKQIIKEGPKPVSKRDLPLEIGREQILHMLDAKALRGLIDMYGADAVTRRVNEKD
jgi:hypothetical protein